ncbi:CACYBP, partial [Cordylochernes scorpioides]
MKCSLDLQEVKTFLVQAKCPRIQELLQAEATRLEAQIQKLAPPAAAAPRPTICSVSKILTYDIRITVKLNVSLNAVHTLAAENFRTSYGPKMVFLEVSDLGGTSHVLTINNLSNPILPHDSYHKVKTDMVVIYLKKEKAGVKWDVITELEKKAIEAKDIQTNEEKENPEKTIMSL